MTWLPKTDVYGGGGYGAKSGIRYGKKPVPSANDTSGEELVDVEDESRKRKRDQERVLERISELSWST